MALPYPHYRWSMASGTPCLTPDTPLRHPHPGSCEAGSPRQGLGQGGRCGGRNRQSAPTHLHLGTGPGPSLAASATQVFWVRTQKKKNVCLCVYVYIYIYVCVYIYIYIWASGPQRHLTKPNGRYSRVKGCSRDQLCGTY